MAAVNHHGKATCVSATAEIIAPKMLKGRSEMLYSSHRSIRHIALITTAILIILRATTLAQSQSFPELPNDLIFAAGRIEQGQELTNVLMRVDKRTLEESEFYRNDNALRLIPISWSPKRNLLAVFSMDLDGTKQICTIGTQGTLTACYTGLLPSYEDVSAYNVQRYPVTWSQDGKRLYFVVDEGIHYEYGTRQLIEIESTSGKKLRTLYQYRSIVDSPLDIAWTSTLDLAVVHIGDSRETPIIIDLQNETETPLGGSGFDMICPYFSSSQLQLVAINRESQLHKYVELVILNKDGTIFETIPFSDYSFSSCPTWSPDERYLYFSAESIDASSWILEYSTTTNYLSEAYRVELSSPFVTSPEGVCFAFGWNTSTGREIRVLCLGEQTRRLGTSLGFATDPIWISN